jgi:hypothetical protein
MTDEKLPTKETGPVVDAIPEPSDPIYQQANRLADRLGLSHPSFGRWERIIFPALHKIVDRLEELEKTSENDGR